MQIVEPEVLVDWYKALVIQRVLSGSTTISENKMVSKRH